MPPLLTAPKLLTFRPSLSFVLLFVLLGVLWLAGGASRADVFGQTVVRAVSWAVLLLILLVGERPSFRALRMPLLILFLCLALIGLQLLPLPPDVWSRLPARAALADGLAAMGQPLSWRPLAIVPDAAANAISALIVPLVTLLLLAGLKPNERPLLPGLMLGFIVASLLIGVIQISGAVIDNPFINDTPGQIAGTFANRNHFALFLALGCALAPVWAFANPGQSTWRLPSALALLLLIVLAILATGSRAGMVLGVVALAAGLVIVRKEARRALRSYPRWVLPVAVLFVLGVLASAVLVSLASGRAVSIDRLFISEVSEDIRSRALPTVLSMIETHMPAGAGFGGFDAGFRMDEPLSLLKQTYFNHAHNDYLEIAFDGGVPGLLLLAGAILWWWVATWRVCRARGNTGFAQAGSVIILLILIGSASDYPARTPMIMAVIAIAAAGLSWRNAQQRG